MQKFNYASPTTIEEACQMLSDYGEKAKVIAGGTNILIQFRDKDEKWKDVNFVVDFNFIPKLRYIEERNGRIHIGPLTTHKDLVNSALLQQKQLLSVKQL